MTAAADFGIAPQTAARLRNLFAAAAGVERVWIYGSRARGEARADSDIDLAVDGPALADADYARLAGAVEAAQLLYGVDLCHWQRVGDAQLRRRIEQDRRVFWQRGQGGVGVQGAARRGAVELKEFQRQALARWTEYLRRLDAHAALAARNAPQLAALEGIDEAARDALRDFPRQVWESLRKDGALPALAAGRDYSARWTAEGERRRPIPNVCLKVPTGGGKTLLAAAAVAAAFTGYFRRTTGLVLWVVPNEAIYRQTRRALADRDHPYRQLLNAAGAGRVKLLEKSSPLTRADVDSHLVVLLLMLQSAARQKSKEILKVFRDRGDVHGFFPREDDLEGHWALLQQVPNLDVYAPLGEAQEQARRQRGALVKDSLGNVLRAVRPLVVIDEGHHGYSETALTTLDGFNPALLLELSATPRLAGRKRGAGGSNVLVDVRGTDLEAAEMIKLPINVDVRPWSDWKSCLTAAVEKLRALDVEAQRLNAETLRYVRPILLVQVERTGREQRDSGFIHAEDARAHLKQLGFADAQIAEKTSEKDELAAERNKDLLSPANPVRAIVTRQALQEGWDCPFAYVLCALAAGRQQSALTQLLGRILRQPDTLKTASPALNECYVFCNDARTADVVTAVKRSLEEEGMGDLAAAVRAGDGTTAPQTRVRRRRAALRDLRIFLPRVSIDDGDRRRELAYDSDVLDGIDWQAVVPAALLGTWAPDARGAREAVVRMGLEVLRPGALPTAVLAADGAAPLDRARIVRALIDLIPNPWLWWQWLDALLAGLAMRGFDETQVATSTASLIEALRLGAIAERDRLAEARFEHLVRAGRVRFSLVADALDYELPTEVTEELAPGARPLARGDGQPIGKSLLEPVYDTGFNGMEAEFACYLDSQAALHWWHRNVARAQYGLQGWRRDKVYPDFVFARVEADGGERLVVMETKGLHLKGSDDTKYKRRLLERLTAMFRDERMARAGELELVGRGGTRLVCDLVVAEGWQGQLAARYFAAAD